MFNYWNVDFFRIIKKNWEWWWVLYWSSPHSSVTTKRLECTRIQRLTTPSPSGQLSLSPERSSGWREGLQTKIFNERRFSPARHGRKLFIKILFSNLLALPQKNVNIWDLQKTRLWLKADVLKGYLQDTYKLWRIKWFVIAAHRLTLVVHQELFKIPPGMCSQKYLFNG